MILARHTAAAKLIHVAGDLYYVSAPSLRSMATLADVLKARFGLAPDSPDPAKNPDMETTARVGLGDAEAIDYFCDPSQGLPVLLHALARRDHPNLTVTDWGRIVAAHVTHNPDDDLAAIIRTAFACFHRLEEGDADDPDYPWKDMSHWFRAWFRRREAIRSGKHRSGSAGHDDGPIERANFDKIASYFARQGYRPEDVAELTLDQLHFVTTGGQDDAKMSGIDGFGAWLEFIRVPEHQTRIQAMRERQQAADAAWVAAHPEQAARNKAQNDYWAAQKYSR